MPAFPNLDNKAIDALSDYIVGLGKNKIIKIENAEKILEIPWVANGHLELKTKNGYPISETPWGTLSRINLDEGKVDWQIPLGTYPELEKRGNSPTGTFNMGGPLVTAGELIFIGATMDERFRVFDKSSGRMLWDCLLYTSPSPRDS